MVKEINKICSTVLEANLLLPTVYFEEGKISFTIDLFTWRVAEFTLFL